MSDNLPVPFEPAIHEPVELGYRKAETRAAVPDALGVVVAAGVSALAERFLDDLL